MHVTPASASPYHPENVPLHWRSDLPQASAA